MIPVIAQRRLLVNQRLCGVRKVNMRISRDFVRVRVNGTEVNAASQGQTIDDVEVMTPEKAEKAMQISLGSALQLTVSLTLAQIVFGFGLSPWIVQSLKDYPQIGQGLGPLTSQIALIGTAGWLIRRSLATNDTDNKRFFRYIAKPDQFLLVGVLTLGTIIGGVALGQFADPTSESNASDVASAIDLYEPFTMLGTGLATSLLSPWIEERIYRGVILQGFLPHVGAPLAVVISSAVFAGSHLTPSGFPVLFLFGLGLGTAHVVCGKNLLVPTAAHSAYNMAVFLFVIATVTAH